MLQISPKGIRWSLNFRRFGGELIFKEEPLHIDALAKGFYKWGLVRSMESEFSIHHP
jgi:hypothetical protein